MARSIRKAAVLGAGVTACRYDPVNNVTRRCSVPGCRHQRVGALQGGVDLLHHARQRLAIGGVCGRGRNPTLRIWASDIPRLD